MTTRTPSRASSSRSSAPAPAKAAGKTGAKKATGGSAARRPATRKTAAKSGTGSKTPARKAPARKTPARAAAAKSSPARSARKTAPVKKAAESAAAKKPAPAKKTSTAKSAPAAKAPAKKPAASKGPAPKAPAKKPAAAKKSPAKKAAVAKAPVKKAAAAKKSSVKPAKASAKAAGKTTAKSASAKAPAKKAAKKAPAKKAATKAKTPAKSVAAAKAPPKKAGTASAKKAPAKTTGKTPPKASGKATAKKASGGKSAAAKKAPAKKQVAAVEKPVAKKPSPKKAPAPKPVAKKAPVRKPAPKKRVSRFSVGDRVAHPRHGTAVITGLKQIEIDGEKRDGFVLGVFVEQLTVPVPMGGDDQAIRPIVSKTAAGRVLRVLRDEPQEADSDWRVWYKALGEKKDSGDIFQAAEVVRDLTHAKSKKGLSDTLKQMLSESRGAVVGEIAFALEISQEEAVARVDKALTVSAKPPAPKPVAKKAPARKRVPKKQAPKNRASRFSVGDKVAHPQHGVAVITGVKQIDLDGEDRDYFVLDIFIEQLTVSVPMDSIEQSIRPVISKTAVSRVLRVLRDEPQDAGSNWSRWYKVLGEKKDSGDIYQVAEVVRDLTHSQNRKGISPALKRMLSKSRQILTGEIAFALNVDQEEAAARVDKVLPLLESGS